MMMLAVLVYICCFSVQFFDGIQKERIAAQKSPHQFNDTSLVWKAFVITFAALAATGILWILIVCVFIIIIASIIAVILWKTSIAAFNIIATISVNSRVNLWKISVNAFNIICDQASKNQPCGHI